MRFEHKAAIQQVLSRLPGGESLNYLLQRHVTRVYPRSEASFANKVRRATQHLQRLQRYAPEVSLPEGTFLEIGAGWDLIIPLTYAACGVGQQQLIDHVRHFRPELVSKTLQRLEGFRPQLEKDLQLDTRALGGPVRHAEELAARLGIHLKAPCDARDTALAAGSVQFISSTSTMEHLYVEHIPRILEEWRRLLARGGVVSCHVDLKDHYWSADKRISCYHFLQYSESAWRQYNPPIHHQNRLRAPQYLELFQQAGFLIRESELDGPDAADLARLSKVPVHPDFQRFSPEDLGAKIVWIVAGADS